MPTFTTAFTPPDPVPELIIDADEDASAINLSWAPTTVAEVDFGGYRLYRSMDGGLNFELLTVLAGVNDVEYSDYAAPLNVDLVYRITQANLDFESDPTDASVQLASEAWQIVTPGDTSLTFPVPRQRSGEATAAKAQDVFRPIGRPGALVVGDVVYAESGTLTFLAMPDNLPVIGLLRRVQARMEGTLLLKATDGTVWSVKYGDISRRFSASGIQELSIPFIGEG